MNPKEKRLPFNLLKHNRLKVAEPTGIEPATSKATGQSVVFPVMTDSDIQLIERELAITLPGSYKRAVVPFRIPAMVGNTDSQLSDDAKRLITLNRELRAGSSFRPAWPPHLFAVGDPHGDELIALDTRTLDGPVWWLDHGLVGSDSNYQAHPRFADWVEQFYPILDQTLRATAMTPTAFPKLSTPHKAPTRNKVFSAAWQSSSSSFLPSLRSYTSADEKAAGKHNSQGRS
ncbi:MAG: SMI1/KNR4 family protein [Pyrinomonadaceae bacterium]|nr:SMI1/KNR4 family protein [Pyrinomonadaceae bacterium]